MLLRVIIILILFTNSVFAQDEWSWWNEKHNWDGVTPWNQYITLSSAYMGPNALPVPEVRTGLIDSLASVKIAYDYYSSKGDKTQDFFLEGKLPLFNNRVSVEISAVPLEWYKMDTVTRDIRAVRTQSGEGSAGGDIYLTTCFQIIKDKKFPDVVLRYSLKTASGTHLRDARFTDAPGYFTDLSFGKNILLKEKNIFRWFFNGGLFVYQTYDINHSQNDCVYYGGGFLFASKNIKWTNDLSGYSGYFNNGDHPLVFRSELKFIRKYISWEFSFLKGLNDYDYERYRVAIIAEIPSVKLFK